MDSAMRRSSLIGDSCEVLNAEGTLWRESRSSDAGDTAKRYKSHTFSSLMVKWILIHSTHHITSQYFRNISTH